MKTFTVRDLDRRPSEVLDACDKEGLVRVRRRDGRMYSIRPEMEPPIKTEWVKLWKEHRARIKKIFPKPIPQEQVEAVDKLIAGE